MNFSFIHLTDHHLPASEAALVLGFSPAYAFRAVMRHIAEHVADRADSMVSTGDLVETASAGAYQTFGRMLRLPAPSAAAPGPLPVSLEGLQAFPLYCLPGNHDDRRHFFRELFPHQPPMPLMNVAYTHQGVQFICLDWGPASKAVAHRETLDFLTRALQTDMPSIILMHHHVVPVGSRWLDAFIADDVGRFWEAIHGHPVLGVFCGHAHMTYDRVVGRVPVFGLRSTAFQFALTEAPLACLLPPHYRVVTVQDGALTTRLFEVPL